METDTDSTRTTARRLLAALPALIDPGDPGWAYRMLLPLTLVAVLPVLILLASGALVTPRAVPEAAITPEIERAAERHAARRLDALSRATGPATLSDPPLSDGPYARLDFEAIARVDAVLKAQIGAARGAPAAAAEPGFRSYRAQLFLIGGGLLGGFIVLLTLIYQFRLIRRSWNIGLRAMYGHEYDRATVGQFVLVLLPFAALALGLPVFVDLSGAQPQGDGMWTGGFAAATALVVLGLIGAIGVLHGLSAMRRPEQGAGRRYWPELLHETTPAWMAGMAAVAAAPLAILAIRDLALPGGLGADLLGASGPGPWLVATGLVVMTTAIAITYFGTRLAVRGFPDIEAVESVFDTADLQRDSDFQNAPKLWRAMLQLHREGPGAGRTPPPVYPGAQPEQARALVEAMTRALLLAMIVALVVVSLALDWIILRAEPGATLEAGLRLAAQAWLYLLGAGFSLALGIVYLGPSVRIDPYVDAYRAGRKLFEPDAADRAPASASDAAPRQWTGSVAITRRGHYAFHLAEAPAGTDDAPEPATRAAAIGVGQAAGKPATSPEERALARRLGADAYKVAAILGVVSYGAAFHSLLDKGLRGRITQIATLIAPAAASVFLNLLK
jgi:hypothetical protein